MVHKFAAWLNTCSGLSNSKPVEVYIDGKHRYLGVIAEHRWPYIPTERAVTDGVVKAGEVRLSHRIYLLGKVHQLCTGNRTLTWEHHLPYDPRVEQSVGEWYLAMHSGYITPQNDKFSPYGPIFGLFEWTVPTYGACKGQRIDHYERKPYKRIPMTVNALQEQCSA